MKVFLACPSYGMDCQCMKAVLATVGVDHDVEMISFCASDLALCFNALYCQALNRRAEGFTHFAMVHSDIWCEANWLDKMMHELSEHKADVVSVVVSMKDHPEYTSTARIVHHENGQTEFKKLTFDEVFSLPKTFSATDIDADGLAVNTGLFVMRITEEWATPPQFPGFQMTNAIITENGKFRPVSMGEDFGASLIWSKRGLRVMATTAVRTMHFGLKGYPNWREVAHTK